jgi:hypothetical protein
MTAKKQYGMPVRNRLRASDGIRRVADLMFEETAGGFDIGRVASARWIS